MENNRENKERKRHRNDLLLLLLLAAAAGVFLFSGRGKRLSGGCLLVITVDGREVLRETVRKEKTLTIDCGDGAYNRIRVCVSEDGTVGIRCEESNCKEQICVSQGLVTLESDAIVCLPHRMTARLLPAASAAALSGDWGVRMP